MVGGKAEGEGARGVVGRHRAGVVAAIISADKGRRCRSAVVDVQVIVVCFSLKTDEVDVDSMIGIGGKEGHRVLFAVAVIAVWTAVVVEHSVTGSDGTVVHVVRLAHVDVIMFGDGLGLAIAFGDGEGDIVDADGIVGDVRRILGVGSSRRASFEGPSPADKIGPPTVISEVDALARCDIGCVGVEVWNETFAGFKLHVFDDGLAIGHGDGMGLGIIAVASVGHIVGATFDGTMVVARRQMAMDNGISIIMAFNGDGGVERLPVGGVGHGAVDAIKALVHEGEDGAFVVVPEIGQLVGIGRLRVGAFDSQLAALGIAVHVILTATANHVPLCAVGDAVVVVCHVV